MNILAECECGAEADRTPTPRTVNAFTCRACGERWEMHFQGGGYAERVILASPGMSLGSIPASADTRYRTNYNFSENWHDGNNGVESWWTFPIDLDMVMLGQRVTTALDA